MKTNIRIPVKKRNIVVNVQYATKFTGIPKEKQFRTWVSAALPDHYDQTELTIRIVDEDEGAMLNEQWRKSHGPTNVLSFPYAGAGDEYTPGLLGDIVICAPVIAREALDQNKSPESHWAHMVIHGTLHLLGYDHVKPDEFERMENMEIKILEYLGYDDPYQYIDKI